MAAEAYSSADEIKRLDVIQVKYESAENEIGCYIPQIQDFKFAVSKLHFAAYAKDEELIAAYNQVIHFKRIIDRLEPQVLELQDVLKINESLKKGVDKLQRVRVSLLEKNEQLKGENDELEVLRPSLFLQKTCLLLLLRLPLVK
ncbi:hypothetical protein ACFX2I_018850 [Malus domestica]